MRKFIIIVLTALMSTVAAMAQISTGESSTSSSTIDAAKQYNPVQTATISLGVAPDARGGAMGDVGAATEPDENSQYWNPAKYAFAYSRAGISVNYTPWLRKLVGGINLAYVSGYTKFGYNDNQAISASFRYFSLGEVEAYNTDGNLVQVINPFEMAIDLGYSRMLSENFSMGVVMRYIHSDMTYDDGDNEPANTFAADVAAYYTAFPQLGYSECQWSWGLNLSNIGGKVSYDGNATSQFLPCNLRIGTSFTFPLDDYNLLSINYDANKFLVPTFPQSWQFYDESGQVDQEAFEAAKQDYYDMSGIKGIFKSFNDAPGGQKEEFHEINWGLGLEYTYDRRFFLRAGYHYENEYKGDRKYFTFGAGVNFNAFHIDGGYVLSTAQTSALDQTLRFSLGFDLEGIRDLMGGKRRR
ncbi:MAG: type IX secretion system outer membrane channel protein PorV [Bacteroidales bacterium]|nr:type IX secretion system outer membrane channel protein PorV [Bacteroidales bacterium]MBO7379561.1 type IX secretion system outer membrane channel protein PorV [Bacteroidales bacterium]